MQPYQGRSPIINVTSNACVFAGKRFLRDFLEIENLSIYPNPIKRETRVLNVISSNKETIDVNIYDLLGKNYISGQVVNDKVDVSNLTSGVYIARFNQGDRQSSKRIIVK